MKATELRIGNFVDFNREETITVMKIEASYVNQPSSVKKVLYPTEHLNGIPLTEEWLLKFGFERDKTLIGRFELKDWDFVFYTDSLSLELKACWDCGGYEVDAKHVHQLQNLYFALTGEELTIKQTSND